MYLKNLYISIAACIREKNRCNNRRKTKEWQTLDISIASEDLYFSLAEHKAFWARKTDRLKKRGRPRNRETDGEKATKSRRIRGMTIILYINQILYLLFTTAYTGHGIWSNLIYLRALRAQTQINGLLVLFLTGEAYGDWINSWSGDDAWYSLYVTERV